MKNKKKVQPWILFLAGAAILANIATGLAAPGSPGVLLRTTMIPAGFLTVSPRLETEPDTNNIQEPPKACQEFSVGGEK